MGCRTDRTRSGLREPDGETGEGRTPRTPAFVLFGLPEEHRTDDVLGAGDVGDAQPGVLLGSDAEHPVHGAMDLRLGVARTGVFGRRATDRPAEEPDHDEAILAIDRICETLVVLEPEDRVQLGEGVLVHESLQDPAPDLDTRGLPRCTLRSGQTLNFHATRLHSDRIDGLAPPTEKGVDEGSGGEEQEGARDGGEDHRRGLRRPEGQREGVQRRGESGVGRSPEGADGQQDGNEELGTGEETLEEQEQKHGSFQESGVQRWPKNSITKMKIWQGKAKFYE